MVLGRLKEGGEHLGNINLYEGVRVMKEGVAKEYSKVRRVEIK